MERALIHDDFLQSSQLHQLPGLNRRLQLLDDKTSVKQVTAEYFTSMSEARCYVDYWSEEATDSDC